VRYIGDKWERLEMEMDGLLWYNLIGVWVDVSMQFSGNEKSKLNPVKPQIGSL
jgi:hypothetical protein